jgi:hypothetical protein
MFAISTCGAKSDIPEDGKHIMPKRVGCERILIYGVKVFKVLKVLMFFGKFE